MNRKKDTQEQGRAKEGQALSLISRDLLFAQTART